MLMLSPNLLQTTPTTVLQVCVQHLQAWGITSWSTGYKCRPPPKTLYIIHLLLQLAKSMLPLPPIMHSPAHAKRGTEPHKNTHNMHNSTCTTAKRSNPLQTPKLH